MTSTERQRRWRAAQKLQGRRRVEFWVTEIEGKVLKGTLEDYRAYEKLINHIAPSPLIDDIKSLDPVETPSTQMMK